MIGRNIKRLRRVKGYSQEQLARKLNVTQGAVSHWEKGTSNPEAKEGEIPPWVEFDIVPYSLRKSFCVMCRDAGVELNTCCKWMGHADSKMVLQVYDSVSEDRSEQERKKVEKRLVKVQKEVQTENEEPETVEK